MTDLTRPRNVDGRARMARALSQLAIARQAADFGDDAQRIYVTLLTDLDAELVAQACFRLAAAPREAFASTMPSAGDIRSMVATLVNEHAAETAAAKLLPLPKEDEEGPRFVCVLCWDTGWTERWCRGVTPQAVSEQTTAKGAAYKIHLRCGRQRTHYPHGWVDVCGCVPTNPVVAKLRERPTLTTKRRSK